MCIYINYTHQVKQQKAYIIPNTKTLSSTITRNCLCLVMVVGTGYLSVCFIKRVSVTTSRLGLRLTWEHETKVGGGVDEDEDANKVRFTVLTLPFL